MGDSSFFPVGAGGTSTETQQAPGTPTTSDTMPGTPTRTQVRGGTPTAADASFVPSTPSQDQDVHVESGTVISGTNPILRLTLTNGSTIDIPVSGLVGQRGDRGPTGPAGASIAGTPGRGIQSLTANTPSLGQPTTLDITFTDGSTQDFIIAAGVAGATGDDGADGVSVTSATVNGDGDLIITLSDGMTVNAGAVVGAQGNSITSVSGTKVGETVTLDIAIENSGVQQVTFTVPDGTTGPAGVSVTSGAVNAQNELVLTLSDGSTVNVGNVRGPAGPAGMDSTVAGPAGRGIDSIDRSQTGNAVTLTFNYSDGSTEAETFSTVASIPQDSVSVTFGGNRELAVTVDGATDSVVIPPATGIVDVVFNDATNDLTVTVDGVSDTANIPNTIIPPTTVNTLFDENTRVLTTIVDGINSVVTIPGGTGTGPGTGTGNTTLKELRSTDALIAEELRYSPDNKLYRTVAFGTFLQETHKTQQSQSATEGRFVVDGIDIDLSKGTLDLGDFPNGFQLGA